MRPGFACTHVTDQGHPACTVHHDVPLDERESGWSLQCAAEHENSEWVIVDLDRYIDQDLELQRLRDTLEEGWKATRSAPDQPWVVEPIPGDDDHAAA